MTTTPITCPACLGFGRRHGIHGGPGEPCTRCGGSGVVDPATVPPDLTAALQRLIDERTLSAVDLAATISGAIAAAAERLPTASRFCLMDRIGDYCQREADQMLQERADDRENGDDP